MFYTYEKQHNIEDKNSFWTCEYLHFFPVLLLMEYYILDSFSVSIMISHFVEKASDLWASQASVNTVLYTYLYKHFNM